MLRWAGQPLLLAALCLAAGTAAIARDTPYAQLSAYKAEARHSAAPQTPYVSHDQPSRLAAAVNAQQACRQANRGRRAGGHCELVKSGDASITTAAEIIRAVPDRRHPLFLWRYRSATARVFLAGSVHILKPGLYPLPEQFQQAFDLTETLVVEVDLTAFSPQQLQQKTFEYGLLPDKTLQQVLPASVYARLDKVTSQYGLPLANLARFKPALVSQQLAVSALVSVGYDPSAGVETHFTRQATSEGKPIQQLESIDLQLDLLLNQPLAVQQQLIEDSLQQMDNFEAMTAALITAWLSGDDRTFAEVFKAQSGSSEAAVEFLRQLIDVRNVGMADTVAGLLRGQGSYFVLVGAGHFVGENSLIKLLKARGLEGQRVYSDQTLSDPTLSDRTLSDRTISNQTISDPSLGGPQH